MYVEYYFKLYSYLCFGHKKIGFVTACMVLKILSRTSILVCQGEHIRLLQRMGLVIQKPTCYIIFKIGQVYPFVKASILVGQGEHIRLTRRVCSFGKASILVQQGEYTSLARRVYSFGKAEYTRLARRVYSSSAASGLRKKFSRLSFIREIKAIKNKHLLQTSTIKKKHKIKNLDYKTFSKLHKN